MEPETPNIAQASQHEKRAKGALEEDDSLWDTDSEIDEVCFPTPPVLRTSTPSLEIL